MGIFEKGDAAGLRLALLLSKARRGEFEECSAPHQKFDLVRVVLNLSNQDVDLQPITAASRIRQILD